MVYPLMDGTASRGAPTEAIGVERRTPFGDATSFLALNQWRSEGAEGAERPGGNHERRQMGWGYNGKNARDKGASHDFLGWQNCSPPRAPIGHSTALLSTIER